MRKALLVEGERARRLATLVERDGQVERRLRGASPATCRTFELSAASAVLPERWRAMPRLFRAAPFKSSGGRGQRALEVLGERRRSVRRRAGGCPEETTPWRASPDPGATPAPDRAALRLGQTQPPPPRSKPAPHREPCGHGRRAVRCWSPGPDRDTKHVAAPAWSAALAALPARAPQISIPGEPFDGFTAVSSQERNLTERDVQAGE